jgi:hypothetical protein
MTPTSKWTNRRDVSVKVRHDKMVGFGQRAMNDKRGTMSARHDGVSQVEAE